MPPSNEATPWREMLALAMRLGVLPQAFWRLSLREWRALSAPVPAVMSRRALAALVEQFPDVG